MLKRLMKNMALSILPIRRFVELLEHSRTTVTQLTELRAQIAEVKAQIANLNTDVRAQTQDLNVDLHALNGDLHALSRDLSKDLHALIGDLDADLKARTSDLDADMHALAYDLNADMHALTDDLKELLNVWAGNPWAEYYGSGEPIATSPVPAPTRQVEGEIDSVLVSVVIPFYNRTGMAIEAINSALRQSHRCLEIIVIDDGSSENPREVQKLCASDPRCVYLSRTHQGVAGARNAGIQKAAGKYIALLDSDDLWEPEKIREQLRAMMQSDWAFSHTSFFRLGKDGVRKLVNSGTFSGSVYPRIIWDCRIATPTVMARQDVLKHHAFPTHLSIAEDIITWIEIAREHAIHGLESAHTIVRVAETSNANDPRKLQKGLENILAYVSADSRFDDNLKEKAYLARNIVKAYHTWGSRQEILNAAPIQRRNAVHE